MGKREETIASIIEQTTYLLTKEGVGGLSMRKVADLTKIRLSNLQYYFKDRDELLKATIDHYFKQCQEDVLKSLPSPANKTSTTLEDILRETLQQGLIVGEVNAQCAMFREIWALSTRNSNIATSLQDYYRQYCQWLVQLIASYTTQPKVVVSLLTPYVEGYSITGASLPLGKKEVIALLIKLVKVVEND